jgi:hypothetical protein
MSIQDDFTAALEQIAEGKRHQQAKVQAEADRRQEINTKGADMLRRQFEQLDADGQPSPDLPSTPADDPDNIFNLLPRF